MIHRHNNATSRSPDAAGTLPEVRRHLEIQPPSRQGRFVSLVPLASRHTEFLYGLAVDEAVGFRWRFRGAIPSLEQFQACLWDAVLCQFVVIDRRSQQPVGHVVAYNYDLHQGYVYVGVVMASDSTATGKGAEAAALLIRYIFETYNVEKLYFEVPEFNIHSVKSVLGLVFEEEARFRGHLYYGGRKWDLLVCALYRRVYANILHTDRGVIRLPQASV